MNSRQLPTRPAPRPASGLAACVAACVLWVAAAPAPAQSARPAPRASATGPAPATTQPAASQPAPAPAPSQLGQTAIRREPRDFARAGPDTQPSEAASPAAAPTFGAPRVAGALAVVLGLIFALRWVLCRSMHPAGAPGRSGVVQVLTRSPLTPRQQLLLVRVGRRLLVVADCNGQLTPLSELTDPDEVASLVGQLRDEKLTAAGHSFGNLLGRLRRAHGTPEDESDDDTFPRVPPDVPDSPALRRGGGGVEDHPEDEEPAVASARGEIQGLTDRVRLISNQFKRP